MQDSLNATVDQVRLITSRYDRGEVDQIRVWIGGKPFHADITNCHDVSLAEAIAEANGLDLMDFRKVRNEPEP